MEKCVTHHLPAWVLPLGAACLLCPGIKGGRQGLGQSSARSKDKSGCRGSGGEGRVFQLGRDNPSSRFGGSRRSSFSLLGRRTLAFQAPPASCSKAGGIKPRQATLDEYNLLILTKTKYKTEANSPFSPFAGISAAVACGRRAGRWPRGPGRWPVPPEAAGQGRTGWRRGCEAGAGAARGWLGAARGWGCPGLGAGGCGGAVRPLAGAMGLAGGCSSINTNGLAAALGRGERRRRSRLGRAAGGGDVPS